MTSTTNAVDVLGHPGSQTPTKIRKCEQHGEFESRQFPNGLWTRCPVCEQAWEQQRRQREAQAEENRRKERRRAMLDASGIEGRFLQATFESFVTSTPAQTKAKAACEEFARDFRRDQAAGLLLIGPPGTGKTHLGCAIALDVIQRHEAGARVATARQIIRELRATWKRDAEESEEDVINRFGRVSLLVLDEVGVGFDSDAERTQLLDVLDLRYRLQRPTVVLSNLNRKLMSEALGERTYDRIREGARTLVMDWPSHRARADRRDRAAD